MAKSKIHPQFFHTLAPDFHTHLMIPEDFYIKYIEGTNVDNSSVELKFDTSVITWKVKVTGRKLSDGWEEFVVANNFEIGDVVVVRYVGELVFQVFDLGPNFSAIPPPGNNNDAQDKNGKTLSKKRLCPRDFSSEDEDDMGFSRKKKLTKKNAETESFVATVTASNLHTNTMCLPQHFTSSNGISTTCHQIVSKDEGERSWALDLESSKSSDTFNISRGWRNFCDDDGLFKLTENEETPVLSLCPAETTDDARQRDSSEASWRESLSSGLSSETEGESCSMERKKCHMRHPPYSSYSPCRKQSIIVTLPRDYVRIERLSLPAPFLRDNGIDKPCKMYLSDYNGKKWPTNLKQDNKGTMRLGVGWKDFIKANGLNTGESFGLKLTWEDTTPVLSLCPTETESFVATVTAWNLCTNTLCLPQDFTSSNGISAKCHQIVLKYGERSWTLDLVFNRSSDTFYIRGWKNFCDDNGQTAGGFFMFKLVENGEMPVLSFCPTKSTHDTRERDCSETSLREFVSSGINSEKEGEISSMLSLMDIEKKKCSPRHPPYSSYSPCRKQSIKVTLPRDYVKIRPMNLPASFLRDNGISKPCMMYLLDHDGKKWSTNLRMDNKGTMGLGAGWIDFVKANGLKAGESFELKLTWEDTTPVLSLCLAELSIESGAGRECSETSQKKSLPIEPISCEKTIKEENIEVETLSLDSGKNHLRERDSSPSNQNPFVTLNIARSNSGRLVIPAPFARENSINKPGMMIYLSRKDGTKWLTVLHQGKDGRVSLGKGWREFAEANDLNSGDSFMAELIWEDTTPILRLVCSEANEKEPVSTEPRSKAIQNFFDGNDQTAGSFLPVENGETPVLSFCPVESTDVTRQKECCQASWRESISPRLSSGENSSMRSLMDIDKKKCNLRHQPYSSYSPWHKQSIKVTLPQDYVKIRSLSLPAPFLRDNGISKPCTMYLSDKDGKKWHINLVQDNKGIMKLGLGWKDFIKANGLNTGESFWLKLTWEDTTPVLSLCPAEFSGCYTTRKNHPGQRDSSPSNQNPFVTLKIPSSGFKKCRLVIPAQFARENSLNKPGMMIYLSRKDGTKWFSTLLQDKEGRVSLGRGWKEFAQANDLNSGDSFMVELIWEDATPTFRLVSSEANEKEPVSAEHRSKNSSSAIQNFCDDNVQTTGGFLPLENGETPVLSFCPMESTDVTRRKECSEASWRESIPPRLSCENAKEGESSSVESLMDIDKKKCNLRHQPYSFYSPWHKQFIKVTLPRDYLKIHSLSLPAPFLRDNAISKPCTMYLSDTDGKKWHINLRQDNKGTMKLGVGWKDFIKANGLNTGESFGLKLTWEDTTPVLSLCPAEFSTNRGAGGCSTTNQKEPLPIEPSSCIKEEILLWDVENNHPGQRDSSPSNQNPFVTLRIARAGFKKSRLVIPAQFARENSLNKPGMMIYLSRKDGTKWFTTLLQDKEGRVSLGRGWKEFAQANNLKSGESFKVELTWEDATPILSLVCSEANEKEIRSRDTSSAIQDRLVCSEANEKELVPTETGSRDTSSAIQDRLVCSEASEKQLVSTEPRSIDSFSAIQKQLVFSEVKKELVPTESRSRDSFSAFQDRLICSQGNEFSTEPSPIQNRFVTLALTPEDVKTCKLHLPSQFMKDNGIKRLGRLTILGENKTELRAYLMSRDGNVVLGNGWQEFCETNGVKLGDSFTLEFINEPNTTPVLKFHAQTNFAN